MPGIESLEPTLVWKHFDQIRKIPRCSKHEEKIREHILVFAKQQGLKTSTDPVGNVVILKPATLPTASTRVLSPCCLANARMCSLIFSSCCEQRGIFLI